MVAAGDSDEARALLQRAPAPDLLEADSVTARLVELDFLERWQNMPEGKGLGLACSSYLSGAGLPIYWNAMPHSGVQLKLDRGGGVTVFCGSTEDVAEFLGRGICGVCRGTQEARLGGCCRP